VISPWRARLPHVSERVPLAIVVMEVAGSEVPVGPVEGGLRCDLGLVDDLLKFVLAAGRLGWAVRLREVDPDLRELIDLLGMSERVGLGHDTGTPGAGIARREDRALGLDALG